MAGRVRAMADARSERGGRRDLESRSLMLRRTRQAEGRVHSAGLYVRSETVLYGVYPAQRLVNPQFFWVGTCIDVENPCGGEPTQSPDCARSQWASERLSALPGSRRDPSGQRPTTASQRGPATATGFGTSIQVPARLVFRPWSAIDSSQALPIHSPRFAPDLRSRTLARSC
jgi:hypothetical protein